MSKTVEYQICTMQNSHITFVNGEWQGTVGPAGVDPNEALNSCPLAWDYLRTAGQAGWELVTALNQPADGTHMQMLFLKRGQ